MTVTIEKWGVYNKGDELVTTRDGVSETQAREMAERYNKITNTLWYSAKPIPSSK